MTFSRYSDNQCYNYFQADKHSQSDIAVDAYFPENFT